MFKKSTSRRLKDLHRDFDTLKDLLSQTKTDIRKMAGGLLLQSFETMKDKSCELQDKMRQQITEKPIHALSCVLMGGVLLGYLLRSQKRRR